MKNFFYFLAAAVIMLSVAACDKEKQPKTPELDHFELNLDLTYAKDMVDSFELNYTVTSGRRKVASGIITSTTSTIQVTDGITTGNLDINITPKSKAGFPVVNKAYNMSFGMKATVTVYYTDGKSMNIGDITLPPSANVFTLEDASDTAEFISVMESINTVKESFFLYQDGDMYFAD